MAVTVKSRNGKKVVLLNPSEKGAKFAKELKQGYKRTNAGAFKLDKSGKGIKLNAVERAYRGGYLDARQDNADVYNAKRSKRRK